MDGWPSAYFSSSWFSNANGGIPKFLLQVGSPGKSLLKPHLEMSLAANLSARAIGRFFIVNPSLGIKGL